MRCPHGLKLSARTSVHALASQSELAVIDHDVRAAGHEYLFFVCNRFDRSLSLRTDTEQLDSRTFASAKTEQTDHALDRRLAPFVTYFDTGIETARRFTSARRRPRMQTTRVDQRDLLTRFFGHVGGARLARCVCRFAAASAQHQQRRFARKRAGRRRI